MRIKPHVVACTVHKVFFVGRPCRVFVLYIGFIKQAKAKEFACHYFAHLYVVLFPQRTRCKQFCSLVFHTQHSIVHLALARCKTPVNRNGTGKVAAVVSVFGSNVKQYKVAIVALLVVFYVVQHVCIITTGNNRRIRKSLTTVANKFVYQLCLQFVLPHTRLGKAQDTAETFFGNITRGLDKIQLLLLFYRTQALQYRVAFSHLVGRVFFFPPFYKTRLAGFGFHGRAVVLVGVYVNRIAIRHDFEKRFFKILKPYNVFNAANFGSAFFGQLFAFPHGYVFVCFAKEQYFAQVFVRSVGAKQQDRLLLVGTTQVKNIAVLSKRQGTVCTYRVNIVRVEYGNAFRLHFGHKLFTVFNEKAAGYLMVFHDNNFIMIPKVGRNGGWQ